MCYKKKLEDALKDENTVYKVVRWIESNFPELKLKESEDERVRKDIMVLVKDWWDRVNKDNISTKEQMIAWLEKQKVTDEEIIFRPVVGTDIRIAAKQALEKIEIGKKVVLAFNGAYIPVNGKTVGEIDSEYDAWLEKQCELTQSLTKISDKVWSKEDEKMYKIALSCIETLEDISNGKNMYADIKDWLQSLKERLSK